ncbi:hypothetical protein DHW03_10530 [Pedobacter yonginense]|uniref:HEPN domain-containing protein n=1 Tax=Pedobacter yonginense TaxID=651869 RepID=A0A317EPY1_9SPHI|nr:hypothetical protein [Pedobacter yonginense]PWS27989.1 hypothetical protein DHW03_10530 [Pedobacter yonginense]
MRLSNLNHTQAIVSELNIFIELLAIKFRPLKIYSFCTITKSNIRTGCFAVGQNQYKTHYFLLMVLESSTIIAHEAQNFGRAHFKHGKITILTHGIETIKACIEKQNRCFITIFNEGELLYNGSEILLPEAKIPFNPSQNYIEAKKHFESRILLAKGFLVAAADCHKNHHYALSVCLIHQVIKQCSLTLIRVHLGYPYGLQHLAQQLDLCCCFSEEPAKLFSSTNEDFQLLDILLRSSAQAKFNRNFKVNAADANKLLSKAYAFFELTETLCMHKIAEFKLQNVKHAEMEASC